MFTTPPRTLFLLTCLLDICANVYSFVNDITNLTPFTRCGTIRQLQQEPNHHYQHQHHYLTTRPTTTTTLHSELLPRSEIIQTLTTQYEISPILSARLVEAAESCLTQWTLKSTPFIRPPEIAALTAAVKTIPDLQVRFCGGYPGAERCRAFFARSDDYAMATEEDWEAVFEERLAVCDIRGNFKFDGGIGHRDFLGSVLGTGIERDRVGDILVRSNDDKDGGGALVFVDPSVVGNIEIALTHVRSVPVTVRRLDSLADIEVPEAKEKEIVSTEASMRLDAVASAGIGMSRSKFMDKVKAGDVLVNWREEKSASRIVAAGDVVTVRGKGRVTVRDVEETSKGKFRVTMLRTI